MLFAAVVLAAPSAVGATLWYSGNLPSDDAVQLFPIMLDAPGIVAARTLSFAGGANGVGGVIAPGGFAPILSLFEATGMQLLLALDFGGGSGPGCGPRPTDPGSGFCWDAHISVDLAAGSYVFALSQDDNLPFGPTLSDGFLRSSQGDFTGPSFTGSPGSFTLINGQQRTSAWALEIQGDSVSAVPEPDYALLCAAGLLAIGISRRRSRR